MAKSRNQVVKKSLFLLLICNVVSAQTISFIEKNDTLQKPKYMEFIYLNDKTDISTSILVATISAKGSLSDPVLLYSHIRMHGQKYGANSFKFVNFKKNADKTGELVLSLYFSTYSILGANFHNGPKNSVFIFGDENMLSDKSQSFKVNKTKYEVRAGHFKEFPVKTNEELRITKGGFTGMTIFYEGGGRHSAFYSFSGLGVAGAQSTYSRDGQGIAIGITTGKILPVEPGLAMLLTKIYIQQQ